MNAKHARFREIATKIFSSGGWFRMHKAVIKEVGVTAAAVVHLLVDLHVFAMRKSTYAWDDGWFDCTVEMLRRRTGLSRKRQQRVLKTLSEGKTPLVEVRKTGLPARRQMRVNIDALLQIVSGWFERKDRRSDEKKSKGSEPTSRSDRGRLAIPIGADYINKDHVDKDHVPTCCCHNMWDSGRAAGPPRTQLLPPDRWYDEMAHRFLLMLQRHKSDLVYPDRKTRRRPVSEKTLAKELRRLRDERSVAKQEIEETVAWLEEHYGDAVVAKMRRVSDLYANWGRWREAIVRWEFDEQKQKKSDADDVYAKRRERRKRLVAAVRAWLAANIVVPSAGEHGHGEHGWGTIDGCHDPLDDKTFDRALRACGARPGELTIDDLR